MRQSRYSHSNEQHTFNGSIPKEAEEQVDNEDLAFEMAKVKRRKRRKPKKQIPQRFGSVDYQAPA